MTPAGVGRPARHVPRVAVVSLYFNMYDEQMAGGFAADREAFLGQAISVLSSDAQVLDSWLLVTVDDAALANATLVTLDVDAVVLVPAMVAPPVLVRRALAGVDAPVLLWNVPEVEELTSTWSQPEGASRSTHVGCEMAANVLRRDGVIFETVTCAFGDLSRHGRLHRTLRALAVASLVRRATVLRLGEVQTGYDDVVADASALQRLGVREVCVSLEDWTRAVASTPDASAAEMASRCDGWRRDRVDEAVMATSARIAAALAGLVASSQADCGTVNCHSPYFRQHQELGVTACLAVTLLTGQGVPFSCTGDLPAALALLIGQRLAGAALYGELYTPETGKGEMAFAAGGEGDPALAASGTLRLIPNRMYPGPGGEGIGVAFPVAEGPATIVSVGVGPDRWQVVWATGTVTSRDFPDFDGPYGGWRFDSGDLEDCVTRWIAAGPSHHHALVPGHLDVEMPVVARAAAMDSVRV